MTSFRPALSFFPDDRPGRRFVTVRRLAAVVALLAAAGIGAAAVLLAQWACAVLP